MSDIEVTMYMDVYTGMDLKYLAARTEPLSDKADYITRYKFTVLVPDWNKPDKTIKALAVTEDKS